MMHEWVNAYKILLGKPEGKRPLEDLGVDGRIILNESWTGCICFRTGMSEGKGVLS
jgi:hypothetical protein